MKKLLLFFSVLFLFPHFVLADEVWVQDAATTTSPSLYYAGDPDVMPVSYDYVNTSFAGGAYYQVGVYFDHFAARYCGPVQGPLTYLDDGGYLMEYLPLTGHTSISEIFVRANSSSAVDGANCLSFVGGYQVDGFATNDAVIDVPIGLPFSSSTSATSSTVQVVDNPNFDLFMVVLLFLIVFFCLAYYFRTPSYLIR